jgi:hypothetical protein
VRDLRANLELGKSGRDGGFPEFLISRLNAGRVGDLRANTDFLVHTPMEWSRLRRTRPFVRRLAAEGRTLFERRPLDEGLRWIRQARSDLDAARLLSRRQRIQMQPRLHIRADHM